MSKVISAEKAAELIKDGTTVAWTTSVLSGFAEEMAIAIEKRFLETGAPRDLTITFSSGNGDYPYGDVKGMNHLAHEGLIKKVIGSHIGQSPRLGKLVTENKVECHLFTQGILVHLYRQMAGKKVGVITKTGLGTFIDPRLDGGRINEITKEERVKLIEFEGEEYLYFKPFPIDVAIIRGSVCDEKGNMAMTHEPLLLESLSLASAVHNRGGIVIAQVLYLAKTGTLHPRRVNVPGGLVDYIVQAKPENHLMTTGTFFEPDLCGYFHTPMGSIPPLPLDQRKVIVRRAAMEMLPDSILNLGFGTPTYVASVAVEEGVLEKVTLTTELGNFGGVPCSGLDFPASHNAECTVAHEAMFDFYDGGGLDTAILGFAQADADGNLNVSKFGGRISGPGGFINIADSAKKVVFVSPMTIDAKTAVKDGKLVILKEGKGKKFVNQVEQVSFSGTYARKKGKPIFFVTERAVFSLENEGLTLIEIAPGLEVERDVLSAMEFRPRISPALKEMPRELFMPQWGKLRQIMEENR
ncbi:acyl CoA:acetate/3-ketoacid CoA transferase [Syntrophus aciditrophicus]|nr:CoA-transferase [Syntrophus aciditrophicus]